MPNHQVMQRSLDAPCLSHRLANVLADRQGAAGVEFALLLPVLVVLVMGMVDLGAVAYEQMQVSAAAHAGALYAIANGWNATGITSAINNATPLTINASTLSVAETTNACWTSGVPTKTTATTCASGGGPGTYVQIYAQATVSHLIVWSTIATPPSLSARAVVRIQ